MSNAVDYINIYKTNNNQSQSKQNYKSSSNTKLNSSRDKINYIKNRLSNINYIQNKININNKSNISNSSLVNKNSQFVNKKSTELSNISSSINNQMQISFNINFKDKEGSTFHFEKNNNQSSNIIEDSKNKTINNFKSMTPYNCKENYQKQLNNTSGGCINRVVSPMNINKIKVNNLLKNYNNGNSNVNSNINCSTNSSASKNIINSTNNMLSKGLKNRNCNNSNDNEKLKELIKKIRMVRSKESKSIPNSQRSKVKNKLKSPIYDNGHSSDTNILLYSSNNSRNINHNKLFNLSGNKTRIFEMNLRPKSYSETRNKSKLNNISDDNIIKNYSFTKIKIRKKRPKNVNNNSLNVTSHTYLSNSRNKIVSPLLKLNSNKYLNQNKSRNENNIKINITKRTSNAELVKVNKENHFCNNVVKPNTHKSTNSDIIESFNNNNINSNNAKINSVFQQNIFTMYSNTSLSFNTNKMNYNSNTINYPEKNSLLNSKEKPIKTFNNTNNINNKINNNYKFYNSNFGNNKPISIYKKSNSSINKYFTKDNFNSIDKSIQRLNSLKQIKNLMNKAYMKVDKVSRLSNNKNKCSNKRSVNKTPISQRKSISTKEKNQLNHQKYDNISITNLIYKKMPKSQLNNNINLNDILNHKNKNIKGNDLITMKSFNNKNKSNSEKIIRTKNAINPSNSNTDLKILSKESYNDNSINNKSEFISYNNNNSSLSSRNRKVIIVPSNFSSRYSESLSTKTVYHTPKKISFISHISKPGYNSVKDLIVPKINQDNFFINQNINEEDVSFFGVCDGHGPYGHMVSEYISQTLPSLLIKQYQEQKEKSKINSSIQNLQFNKCKKIFDDIFLIVNSKLTNNISIDSNFSGSTCISILITNGLLISANVGDSRAIKISCNNQLNEWSFEQLSRDHKANEIDEASRIIRYGGRIEPFKEANGKFVGPKRIWLKNEQIPGLAMTRSIGDQIASTVGVICEPEVDFYWLKEDDRAIVVASDGLWEYVSNEEVIGVVKGICADGCFDGIDANDKGEECCKRLYDIAFERWKNNDDCIDDITIVVAFLV